MEEKNLGNTISKLRREQNMTQAELAKKLNITDKAVSKWERNLSYPDITSLSKLAQILNVETSYLIDLCKKENNPYQNKTEINNLIDKILIIVPFAITIALIVLNILDNLTTKETLSLITIAILFQSIYNMKKISQKNS